MKMTKACFFHGVLSYQIFFQLEVQREGAEVFTYQIWCENICLLPRYRKIDLYWGLWESLFTPDSVSLTNNPLSFRLFPIRLCNSQYYLYLNIDLSTEKTKTI